MSLSENLPKLWKTLWPSSADSTPADATDLEAAPLISLIEKPKPVESKSQIKHFLWTIFLYGLTVISSIVVCYYGYAMVMYWDGATINEWEMRWDPSFVRQNALEDCRLVFPGLNVSFCYDKCDQYPETLPQFCLDVLTSNINITNLLPRMRVAYHNRDTVLRQALAFYGLGHAEALRQANNWELYDSTDGVGHLFIYGIAVTFIVVAVITTVWVSLLNWVGDFLFCICGPKKSVVVIKQNPKAVWPLIVVPIVELVFFFILYCILMESFGEFSTPMRYLMTLNEQFRLSVAPQYAPVDAFRGAFQPYPGILALPWSLNYVVIETQSPSPFELCAAFPRSNPDRFCSPTLIVMSEWNGLLPNVAAAITDRRLR